MKNERNAKKVSGSVTEAPIQRKIIAWLPTHLREFKLQEKQVVSVENMED